MGGAQSNYNSSKFRRMAASSLGPYCESTGINGDTLVGNNLDSLPKLSDSRALVNGLVYELGLFRKKHQLEECRTAQHYLSIFCLCDIQPVQFERIC